MLRPMLWSAFAILVLGGTARTATSAITNGGFETGNLTGWSASPSFLASAVNSAAALGGIGEPNWSPVEGNYFAHLVSAEAGTYTMLSQQFTVAAGDVLSFSVFFDAGDYLPFNDDGFVNLLNVSTSTAVTLYAESVASVGDYQSNGWTSVSYAFLAPGTFQLEAGVQNVLDDGLASALGLDAVALQSSAVPEPASLIVWSLLGLTVAGGSWWRRRKRAA